MKCPQDLLSSVHYAFQPRAKMLSLDSGPSTERDEIHLNLVVNSLATRISADRASSSYGFSCVRLDISWIVGSS